ncbi:sensor histidine kinase [Kineococcus sp. SYSU DK004]|uniref:sensor histidine kinase n=1 Tax=Kineococcus sp. SYSU DK004 TaxID=3383125 RepID=UPI003D7E829A
MSSALDQVAVEGREDGRPGAPGGAVPGGSAGPADAAARAATRSRRALRLLGDLALVLAVLLAGVVLLGVELDPELGPRTRGDAVLVLDLLLGAPATLALLARRRWPVAVAAGLTALSVLSTVAGAAAVVALFSVAVRRRWPVVAAVAAGTVAAAVAQALLWPDPVVPLWVVAVLTPLLVLPVVAWGMYARTRHQLVASLREQAARDRREHALRVERARDAERARIAREMHDVLAHRLSLVSMHAGALEVAAGEGREDLARAAGVVRAGAHEALEDLRGVLGVLRAGDVAPAGRAQPVLADLPALVAEARAAGTRVELRTDLPDGAVPPALQGRTAYRAVQEGLTNARKHAPGHRVVVTVAGAPGGELVVEVVDAPDGALLTGAASAPPGSGLGLVGLAERLDLAGGRLEHGPHAGGHRLTARMPWPAPA